MAALRQIKLWTPGFALLFLSRFAKVTADNFAAIAFVWLLVETGGGAVKTAMLYVCSLVPQTLLSPFVSPLLSRGRLNDWMFGSDVVRALIVALVPVCYFSGMLPLWLFYIFVIIQSATGAVYNPASVAFLPRIVKKEKIQEANAFIQTSGEMATLLSLASAGALIFWLSGAAALLNHFRCVFDFGSSCFMYPVHRDFR